MVHRRAKPLFNSENSFFSRDFYSKFEVNPGELKDFFTNLANLYSVYSEELKKICGNKSPSKWMLNARKRILELERLSGAPLKMAEKKLSKLKQSLFKNGNEFKAIISDMEKAEKNGNALESVTLKLQSALASKGISEENSKIIASRFADCIMEISGEKDFLKNADKEAIKNAPKEMAALKKELEKYRDLKVDMGRVLAKEILKYKELCSPVSAVQKAAPDGEWLALIKA